MRASIVRKTKDNVTRDYEIYDGRDDNARHGAPKYSISPHHTPSPSAESATHLPGPYSFPKRKRGEKNNREGHEFHSCQFRVVKDERLSAAEVCF